MRWMKIIGLGEHSDVHGRDRGVQVLPTATHADSVSSDTPRGEHPGHGRAGPLPSKHPPATS